MAMLTISTKGTTTTVKRGNKIVGRVEFRGGNIYDAYSRNGDSAGRFNDLHTACRKADLLYQTKLRDERNVDTDKLMPILNNMDLLKSMDSLAGRWSCEKEYEDWNDYHKVITDKFAAVGAEVLRTTKRPFGAVVAIQGMDNIKIFLKYSGNTVKFATAAA